jgi:hypothetical protein
MLVFGGSKNWLLAGISIMASFVTFFYCWRLWLDEKFFALLTQDNLDDFDKTIEKIWGKEMLRRDLEMRMRATGKLIIRAWCTTAIQWLVGVAATIS